MNSDQSGSVPPCGGPCGDALGQLTGELIRWTKTAPNPVLGDLLHEQLHLGRPVERG
jgi:hypothetical protein